MRPRAVLSWFVYGGLRPAGSLWRFIEDDVLDVTPASVYGVLYTHKTGLYPVTNLSIYGDARIMGVTLDIELTTNSLEVLHMELKSGYMPVWMDELTPDGAPTGRQVLTLEFDHINLSNEMGEVIPTGDWMDNLHAAT